MSTLIRIEHVHHRQPLFDFVNAVVESQLKHYASDLFPELEMNDMDILNHSLARAQQVCTTLNIPIKEHFKKIYRTSENNVYCDYKLSNTAYILVSLNGDVNMKKVAQIQLELANSLLGKL